MAKARHAKLDVPLTPIGMALDEHVDWALSGRPDL